jgi:hypothetical protein
MRASPRSQILHCRRVPSASSTHTEPDKKQDDFEKLMVGAQDALAYADGDKSRGVAHPVSPVDVAAIRKQLELSQAQFSDMFWLKKMPCKSEDMAGADPTARQECFCV